jgi:polyhydroxyalkanoate synthase
MKGLFNLATLWARARPAVGATPADVVHEENKWRLLRYRPASCGVRHRTPVLLVPSLINRHYVLDLMPGKSFAEYMVQQGHEVYIVDWGTPGPEDRFLSFDDVCDRYLGRAVRKVARGCARGQAHVLGYCMGGTLAAIHAAARPDHVASLTALAAPIRFEDDGLLSAWTRSESFDVGALVEAFGNVPCCARRSACPRRCTCSTAPGTTSTSTASWRWRPGAATTCRSPGPATGATSRSCTARTRW